MRKIIGFGCIALGFLSLLIAVGFVFYNRYEETQGEKTSQNLLQELQVSIQEAEQSESVTEEVSEDVSENVTQDVPEHISVDVPKQLPVDVPQASVPAEDYWGMATKPVGNYDSIGILSIPVLKVELPVLTNWSYEKLRKAPCHYYGSCCEPDFVIAAHNYRSHFGRLSQLVAGDLVLFTDVEGTVYCYEVVLLETLFPTATEEMLTSGFDLSLYTCTPGGANRVTVRCSKVQN